MWMQTLLYELYMMSRNCSRFHETHESQRSKARDLLILTSNGMECGRARGMVPLVKQFLHIEMSILAEPELIHPIMNVQHTGKITLHNK
jgi:hypothetical protein